MRGARLYGFWLFLLVVQLLLTSPTFAQVAVVDPSFNPRVRIALVSDPSLADCILLRSAFITNISAARFTVAIVNISLANKRVMIVDGSYARDDVNCLLR